MTQESASDTALTGYIRRDYNPEQYIHRPQITSANRWLNDKMKQILTVASPPATGKTWFLERMRESFDENGIIETLWINAEDFLPEREGHLTVNNNFTDKSKFAFYQELIQQLGSQCEGIGNLPPDEKSDISELIEALAHEICQNCFAGKQVVLFIDDGDLLSDESWHLFERAVIEPLAREKLLRLVIALRNDQKIQSFLLKMNEQRLLLGNLIPDAESGQDQGEAQIQKLSQEFPHVAVQVTHALKAVTSYDKSHPGINTFLFLYAEKHENMELSLDLLRVLLESLNPQSEDDTDELIELLVGVADFANEWVIEELAHWQNVSNTEAWNRIQILIDNWLVVNVSRNRFKISDGVREFVRSILKLQTTFSLETQMDDPTTVVSGLTQIVNVQPQDVRETNIISGNMWVTLELSPEIANQLFVMFLEKDPALMEAGIVHVQYQPKKLFHLIKNHFSADDLRLLCFKLDIVYDDLSGQIRPVKIVQLIEYCQHRDRIPDLLQACQQARPTVNWQI